MTEESAIVEWRKKEGEKIAKGDILFTVETDKSVMEVEAFTDGTLLKIVVQPGVNVPVQSTVGFLGNPGETIPVVEAPKAAAPKPAIAAAPAPAIAVGPLPQRALPLLSNRRVRSRGLQRLPHRPFSASRHAQRHWRNAV
jgi:pyruvate/2-oxoglutarate dehydrogenase complex dihydrolipoamide acyltransferase (E2) component